MIKSGKQFLGTLFFLAALGCVIAFFVATNNYNDGWAMYGTEPPKRPKPLWYFAASGAFLVGSIVMFTRAATDKTSPGLSSPRPAPWEVEAAKDAEIDSEDPK